MNLLLLILTAYALCHVARFAWFLWWEATYLDRLLKAYTHKPARRSLLRMTDRAKRKAKLFDCYIACWASTRKKTAEDCRRILTDLRDIADAIRNERLCGLPDLDMPKYGELVEQSITALERVSREKGRNELADKMDRLADAIGKNL